MKPTAIQQINAPFGAAQVQHIEPIAVGHEGIEALLGGIKISATTRWRWEKAGKIKRVPGISHPLYTVESIRLLVRGTSGSEGRN